MRVDEIEFSGSLNGLDECDGWDDSLILGVIIINMMSSINGRREIAGVIRDIITTKFSLEMTRPGDAPSHIKSFSVEIVLPRCIPIMFHEWCDFMRRSFIEIEAGMRGIVRSFDEGETLKDITITSTYDQAGNFCGWLVFATVS